ncbi:hypothetical protein GOEFS_044_00020 [Gordonia effusa NBRC 100432]|uniref:Uncharacterized protein n=1 Tax=Gordonia effusa NBRC 100432 TaxID=1077974 RepID=H0QYR5_9ACTN|nr:hypothetical protein [Gordonia effusa]GAB17966.1 hypothetical protein GOEFS_044_00020 [Gordonia effusa NBRC 100432]
MSLLSIRRRNIPVPAAEAPVVVETPEPEQGRGIEGWTRIGGAGLVGAGALHFAVPKLFVPLTRVAFPEQTERFVTVNGTLETLIGTALLSARTRLFGYIALAVYLFYLVFNVKTTREEAEAARYAPPNVVPSVVPKPVTDSAASA